VFAGNGTFTGSQYLIPLIGGSGGGGAIGPTCGTYADGGGAGGGAILIASSTTITFGPTQISGIFARGGTRSCRAGNGSGGAIRLIANTVTTICVAFGCPTLNASGPGGNHGLIRVEAFNADINPGGNANVQGSFIKSVPFTPAVPSTAPSTLKPRRGWGHDTYQCEPFQLPGRHDQHSRARHGQRTGTIHPCGNCTQDNRHVRNWTGSDRQLLAVGWNPTDIELQRSDHVSDRRRTGFRESDLVEPMTRLLSLTVGSPLAQGLCRSMSARLLPMER
jgi:hypothetical protein